MMQQRAVRWTEVSRPLVDVGLSRPEVSDASSAASVAASTAPSLIVDELLCTSGSIEIRRMWTDALRHTVLSFYSQTDICQSKRTLIGQFTTLLSSCLFVAERRNSKRQVRTEATVTDMATAIEYIATNRSALDCTPIRY